MTVTFLRNAWYAAAWTDEVGDGLFTRRILDEPVLLRRLGDGSPVALRDRCPHRFAPLSKGTIKGDTITCGYHGLTFDALGKCVGSPFSKTTPAAAKVRAYPVVERDTLLWIWMGDPDKADAAKIPEFGFLNANAHTRTVHGHMMTGANYELGTDNLMDLSHIEFVHTGTFAGAGVIFESNFSVKAEGDAIHSFWDMPNIAPPPWAAMFPPDARVDHWLDMRWQAPASMKLSIGLVPQGGDRGQSMGVVQAHILTPETADSTHYFFANTRGYAIDSTEVDEMDRAQMAIAFGQEDKPMLEAIEANMAGDFWDEKPVLLPIDAGAVRVRRTLASLIAAEAAERLAETTATKIDRAEPVAESLEGVQR